MRCSKYILHNIKARPSAEFADRIERGDPHRHAVEQASRRWRAGELDHLPRPLRRRHGELDAPRAPRPLHAVVARARDHDGDGPEHQ